MKKTLRNIVALPFLLVGVVLGCIAFILAFIAAWFTETGIEITEN